MPGSVQNAVPVTVMPWGLFSAFVHSRELPIRANEYKDGGSQRDKQASSSRKSWSLQRRLTADDLAMLRNYYEARKGPAEPFLVYDVFETVPKFSYDETGQAVPGRYIVRFAGSFEQIITMGRPNASFGLTEIA